MQEILGYKKKILLYAPFPLNKMHEDFDTYYQIVENNAKPIKILFLVENISLYGGVIRTLLLKAKYFSEKFGYDVTILTEHRDSKDFYHNLIMNGKFTVKQFQKFPVIKKYQIIKRIKFFTKLKQFILKENFDYVIATGGRVDILLPYLNIKRVKIIKEIHISNQYRYPKSVIGHINHKFHNYFLKKFNKIIILTNEDRLSWKLNNIEVIPNALSFFPNQTAKLENKTIISCGRLTFQKGFDILIDAWSILHKAYPEWRLEIYGDGDDKELLKNKVNNLGLQNSIFLQGTENNLIDKYLESSIYVMSSRFEGLPMVLLEAMACGLPVVSFACPTGPKDIINNNIDGFLIENGNINEMVNKLEQLILNKEKRKNMGKMARENIQRFSQDRVMEQWKELFEELKASNE